MTSNNPKGILLGGGARNRSESETLRLSNIDLPIFISKLYLKKLIEKEKEERMGDI